MVIKKINRSESTQKIHASMCWCNIHVHLFWWAWPLWFQRYRYIPKTAKFPFQPMDYSPWSSNLIDRNRLKKFMQICVNVTCMYTNFGGCGLSSFGDTTTSKMAKFPFQPMDYSPWSAKNLIDRNRLKKFMQICVDVTYMYTDFGGCDLSGFGDTATFKNGQFSLSTHGL